MFKLVPFTALVFSASLAFAAGYTEPQIARIMKTANDGEVQAANAYLEKGTQADAKRFAEKMAKDHDDNVGELDKVLRKVKIEPADSDMSAKLSVDAAGKVSKIKGAPAGSNLDKVYMQSQVEMHEGLLKELDASLIPGAKTPELNAYLKKTREHVAKHLAEAKSIQAKLK